MDRHWKEEFEDFRKNLKAQEKALMRMRCFNLRQETKKLREEIEDTIGRS